MARSGVLVGVLVLLSACGDDASPPLDAPSGDATPTARLEVGVYGGGAGTILSNPIGIQCGTRCAMDLPVGTSVSLTALADNGSTFAGWADAGCTGTGACNVVLTEDLVVTAMVVQNHSLVVLTTGDGTGVVTSSPIGINCGSDCSEQFSPGQTVTLTASATGTSTFAGWGGACFGADSTCTVTATAAMGAIATFATPRYALTVTKDGTGAGTVSGTGIDCGADCSELVGTGTMVELTATPDATSTFTGWNGGGCTGTGSCTTLVSAATEVKATFSRVHHAVNVATSGSGRVISFPAGIDCGSDCTDVYPQGSQVTLLAFPSAGQVFTGWSGACTGTVTCVVDVQASASVTATFAAQGCDSFIGPDVAYAPGWTRRGGDWRIERGLLRDPSTGFGFFGHVITKNDSSFSDGCVSMTLFHPGLSGHQLHAGAVLRWSSPSSYLVVTLEENPFAAGLYGVDFYQFPSSTGDSQRNLDFGMNPRLEACVVGTTVSVTVDRNHDGVVDFSRTFTTDVTTPGVAGVVSYTNTPASNVISIDDVCWNPAP